jgi:hypothetical protein
LTKVSIPTQTNGHDPVKALFNYRHYSKASEWPSSLAKDIYLNQISMENLNPVYLKQDLQDGRHEGQAEMKVSINSKRRKPLQVNTVTTMPIDNADLISDSVGYA